MRPQLPDAHDSTRCTNCARPLEQSESRIVDEYRNDGSGYREPTGRRWCSVMCKNITVAREGARLSLTYQEA